jgi:hypothetical protein
MNLRELLKKLLRRPPQVDRNERVADRVNEDIVVATEESWSPSHHDERPRD